MPSSTDIAVYDQLASPGNRYGVTTVKDHGNAILGNSYNFGQNFHIAEATIVVYENPVEARFGLAAGVKRCREALASGPASPAVTTVDSDRHQLRKRRKLWTEEDGHAHSITKPAVGPRQFARDRTEQQVPQSCIRRESVVPDLVPGDQVLRILRTASASDWIVPATVLAMLAGRSASFQALLDAVARMRQDTLFPIVTAVLGSCLTRWLLRSSLQNFNTDPSDECRLFIDVYGIERKVPLAYFASEKILDGFLEMHYRNSSAQQFVADHQYTLRVSNEAGWRIMSREGSPRLALAFQKIKMAILYRVTSKRCLECLNKLNGKSERVAW